MATDTPAESSWSPWQPTQLQTLSWLISDQSSVRGECRAERLSSDDVIKHQSENSTDENMNRRSQKDCEIHNSWEQSTQQRFLRREVDRRVQGAVSADQALLDNKRFRLRKMLEAEERQYLQELEAKRETAAEKKDKMSKRLGELKKKREAERQQLVGEKREQQFRRQDVDYRDLQRKRSELEASEHQKAQLRVKQEQRQQQQQEEQLYAQLWEADRQAKEERERRGKETRRQANLKTAQEVLAQSQEAQQRRTEQKKVLQQQEAQQLQQQQEALLLQQQQQQRKKTLQKKTFVRQLDRELQLKKQRVAREQRDEEQLNLSVMRQLPPQLPQQDPDQPQKAEQKRLRLKEDRLLDRKQLQQARQAQKKTEEQRERRTEEQRKEIQLKNDEQRRRQRQASTKLKEEVKDSNRLRVQNRLKEKQLQAVEHQRQVEERLQSEERARRQAQEEKLQQTLHKEAYAADLRAQMLQQPKQQQQQQRRPPIRGVSATTGPGRLLPKRSRLEPNRLRRPDPSPSTLNPITGLRASRTVLPAIPTSIRR
uniref:Trichohyalin-plectin-homology domain-containing protein n=1 Tax=Salarias fasciatus TaxID=181472 RepID=A0A672HQC7_SALFA